MAATESPTVAADKVLGLRSHQVRNGSYLTGEVIDHAYSFCNQLLPGPCYSSSVRIQPSMSTGNSTSIDLSTQVLPRSRLQCQVDVSEQYAAVTQSGCKGKPQALDFYNPKLHQFSAPVFVTMEYEREADSSKPITMELKHSFLAMVCNTHGSGATKDSG